MIDDLSVKIIATADDSSGAKSQLESSLQTLVKGTELKLSKVKIESFDISAAITSIKKDLQNQLKEITITTKVTETTKNGTGTTGTRQQEAYLLDQIYKLQTQINRITDEGNKTLIQQSDIYKQIEQSIASAMDSEQKLSVAQKQALKEQQNELKGVVNELVKAQDTYTKLFQEPPKISTKSFDELGNSIEEIKSSFSKLKSPIEEVNFTIDDLSSSLERIKSMPAGEEQRKEFEQLKIGIQQYEEAIKTASAQDKLNAKIERENVALQKQDSVITGLKQSFDTYLQTHKKILSDPIFAEKAQIILETKIDEKDEVAVRRLRDSIRDFKKEAKDAGYETETFGQKLSQVASKYGIFLTLGMAIRQITSIIKDMISTTIDLDKSLVNIQIATNGTREEANNLLNTYNEMGKTLGATTKDVADSGVEWLRQGYSIAETNKLIEASMILSKVGFLESAEASQYLTSAMKGYRLSVEDVISVVDKLTQVDSKAAVSAGGLAEGMSRVANSARLSGIEMDRLIGMLAVIGETTQKDMASIGTSLNTLFSRMADIKIGKLVEEDGVNITQALSDAEDVLNRVGIALRKDAVTFNDFGDVLDQVAKIWSELNDIEQASIEKAFAGTRNRENFIVLMENYDKVLQYTEESLNSAGSAQDKFDAYLSGTEKSINAFTASFEELSKTIIDSELVTFTYDTGTGILGFLTDIVKSGQTVPALLTAISIAMSTVGKTTLISPLKFDSEGLHLFQTGIKSLMTDISNYNKRLLGLTGTIKADELATKNATVAKYLNQAATQHQTASMGGYISSLIGAKVASIALQVATVALNAALTFGISLLISTGIQAIMSYAQAKEKARDAAIEHANTLESENKSLDEQKNKIRELREELDSGNLSQEEAYNVRKSLYDMQNDLIANYGLETDGINLVTGAIEEQIATIDRLKQANYAEFIRENKDAIDESIKYFETISKDVFQQTFIWQDILNYDDLIQFKDIIDDIGISLEAIEGSRAGKGKLIVLGTPTEQLEQYNELFDSINEQIKDLEGEEKEAGDRILSSVSHRINQLKAEIGTYQETYQNYIDGLVKYDKKYLEEYKKILLGRRNLEKAELSGNKDDIAQAQEDLFVALNDAITKAGTDKAVVEYFKGMYPELKSIMDEWEFKIKFNADEEGLKTTIKEALATLEGLGTIDFENLSIGVGTSEQLEGYAKLKSVAEDYETSVESLIDWLIRLEEIQGQVAQPDIDTSAEDAINAQKKACEDLINQISILSQAEGEMSKNQEISAETYGKIIAMGEDYAKVVSIQGNGFVLLKDKATDLNNSLVESSIQTLDLANASQEQIDQFLKLYKTSDDFSKQISDMSSNLDKAESIFKDFNDTGELSTKNILDLIDAGYASIIMFDEEGNAVGLNAEAFLDLESNMINAKIAKLAIAKADIIASLNAERTKVEELANAYKLMGYNIAGAAAIKAAMDKSEAKIISSEDMLKEIEAQMSALEALLDKVPKTSKAKSDAKSSAKKETDAWKEAFEQQEKNLKYSLDKREISEREYFEKLKDLNEKYFANKEKYLDEYRKYELILYRLFNVNPIAQGCVA